MYKIAESDWKKFKKIKALALDQFCATVLGEVEKQLRDDKSSNHAKYLEIYQLIMEYNKEMAEMFDGHSRSRASLQLTLLRGRGLVCKEDIASLSEEFNIQSKPMDVD